MRRSAEAVAIAAVALALAASRLPVASATAATLIGDGATFAAPEVAQWATDVARSPYDLQVDFTPRSSRDARYDFASGTVDFAVSDIRYQPYPYDTAAPPAGSYLYVPVTAGGLAFMYNLPGVADLHLSSYSVCALLSGAVGYWDDPVVAADNPSTALPHVRVTPVLDSDAAGTNYVLEEYCIAEQPKLWADFVAAQQSYDDTVGVTDVFADQPSSDWPRFPSGVFTSGSTSQADTVAAPQSSGYITAVETAYAIQRHTPVASVRNASGLYVQPSDIDVASALAYAVQQPDGTHVLHFDGLGPAVYNPSTYSYMLVPTGVTPAKGAALGTLVDFALTLGQQQAAGIGYASLGLSLERQGVDRLQGLPGDPPLTTAEQAGYSCGDLTPADVAAGRTTPTCGAANPNTLSTGGPGGSLTPPAAGVPGVAAAGAPAGAAARTGGAGTAAATAGPGRPGVSGGAPATAPGTSGAGPAGGPLAALASLGAYRSGRVAAAPVPVAAVGATGIDARGVALAGLALVVGATLWRRLAGRSR